MTKLTKTEAILLKNIQSLGRKLKALEKKPRRTYPRLIKTIKLQNRNWPYDKEWTGELYSNGDVVTSWGRIGCNLQSKTFRGVGIEYFNKRIWEKYNKGYERVRV
jgi:hypothetical protein